MTQETLIQLLYAFEDSAYADFAQRTIPNIPRDQFIGIRSPQYKKITKILKSDPIEPAFFENLPHMYFEENCVHVALLNSIRDYPTCIQMVERFIPYIDNWATNDSLNPACFAKHHDDLLPRVKRWIASDMPYTRRFGLHILMAHFLDADFEPSLLDQPADLRSDEYYVNMMTAWLFAEALVKQWDAALPYLLDHRLDRWTHNKTIQKAVDSFRINDEQKAYLKSLRRRAE